MICTSCREGAALNTMAAITVYAKESEELLTRADYFHSECEGSCFCQHRTGPNNTSK